MVKKRIPQTISEKDLFRIINFILIKAKKSPSAYKRFTGYRDSTIIFLCYFMGLRPKECKNIRVEDINFEEHTLFIPAMNNKQRNSDSFPIPDFCLNVILSYLDKRQEFFRTKEGWLFPAMDIRTRRIKEISRGTLMRNFSLVLKKLGLLRVSYIDKQGHRKVNLTLYSLRHSFGTNVYSKNRDIRKTAVLLRHYDFLCRSTMVYIHTTQNKTREDLFKEVYSIPLEISS